MGGFGMGGGGGGIPIPIPAGVGGGGALIILLIVIALQVFGGGGGTGGLGGLTGQSGAEPGSSADLSNNGDMVEFMGAVLNDIERPVGGHVPALGPAVRPDDARAVHRRDPVGVRRRELGRPGRSTARPTRRSTSTRTSSRS